MLRRARLIGGLALGWGLLHGLHAGALMLVPALLALPVLAAAWRRWRTSAPNTAARSRR
jgi:hypothetical protein